MNNNPGFLNPIQKYGFVTGFATGFARDLSTEVVCSHVDDDLVVPIVDEHLKPKVGMIFDKLEDGEKFYKSYGKAGGFNIRNYTTNYAKGKELICKTFVCSKEGVCKSKSLDIRQYGSSRTNCKALIRLKLDKNKGVWSVNKFVEEHNHTITSPSRKHLLRGNREVTSTKKALIKQFGEANIPTNKQMAFFESSSGGFDKIGFIETDIRNYERDLREERRGYDAQMMLDFFKWQQEENPLFYYVHEVDDEKRLTHCFWVDGIARINYQHFGDVVSFDATHSTNQYGLVFVPFVGINHHWQSVFLGCGLIPNEEAKSFVWLFNKWVEAMGRPPLGMITDQCLGICKAIETVFLEIRHRFCIWHILDKVPDKLGAWAYRKEFMEPFIQNIWQSETSTYFEEKWISILTENGLETHDWLNDMYEIREKWAPVYHKQYFWAGMSSSQRSESINSLLKKHVSRKNSLYDFVTIFQRVLTRQRQGELKEDHQTIEKKPKLKTLWSMENQMSQIYTRKIFYVFQEEVQQSLLYNLQVVKDDEKESICQLNSCGNDERLRHVIYCKATKMVSCPCHMFEFTGIPCRHILGYLKCSTHRELPEQYILRRWCRNVKRRVVLGDGNIIGEKGTINFASRYSELTCLSNEFVEKGLSSNEAYEITREMLMEGINKLQNLILKNDEESGQDIEKNYFNAEFSEDIVHEPSQARTKGRPKGKRLKSLREIRKCKPRQCKLCEKRENHDSRNCPLKLTSDSMDQDNIDEATAESEDSFEEDEVLTIA